MKGVDAVKLADQGIEACKQAMALKEKYAEAMIYANLLYLKRAMFEPDEQGRAFSQFEAFELRKEAGKILMERKKAKAALEGAAQEGEAKDGEAKEDAAKEEDAAADEKKDT